MEAVVAGVAIGKVLLEAKSHAAESQRIPWNLIRAEQRHFETFHTSRKVRAEQAASIEKMDLTDVGNVDHCEGRFDQDLCAGLLERLSNRSLGCAFAVFHKAGWQGPQAVLGLDCPLA